MYEVIPKIGGGCCGGSTSSCSGKADCGCGCKGKHGRDDDGVNVNVVIGSGNDYSSNPYTGGASPIITPTNVIPPVMNSNIIPPVVSNPTVNPTIVPPTVTNYVGQPKERNPIFLIQGEQGYTTPVKPVTITPVAKPNPIVKSVEAIKQIVNPPTPRRRDVEFT